MCIICEIKSAFVEDPNDPEMLDVDASYVLARVELLGIVAAKLSDAIGSVLDGKLHAMPRGRLRELQMIATALFADSEDAQAFRQEVLSQLTSAAEGRKPQAGSVWQELFGNVKAFKEAQEAPQPYGVSNEVWAMLPDGVKESIRVAIENGAEVIAFKMPTNITKH